MNDDYDSNWEKVYDHREGNTSLLENLKPGTVVRAKSREIPHIVTEGMFAGLFVYENDGREKLVAEVITDDGRILKMPLGSSMDYFKIWIKGEQQKDKT